MSDKPKYDLSSWTDTKYCIGVADGKFGRRIIAHCSNQEDAEQIMDALMGAEIIGQQDLQIISLRSTLAEKDREIEALRNANRVLGETINAQGRALLDAQEKR